MRRLAAALALLVLPAGAQEGYARLTGHGGPVTGVAVSADGKTALTASFDYSVGVWDVDRTARLRWAEGHEAAVNAVLALPGDRALTGGDDFDVILWDTVTGKPLHHFEGHRGKVVGLAVAPGGRLAASAGWDGDVILWDLEARRLVARLDGHEANVNDVAFSEDGARLYSASYDGTIRLWDVAARVQTATLVEHGFGVNRIVLDEARGWLAYGGVDGAIRVIDLATRERIADLTADRRPVLAMAATADRSRLAIGDGQGHIMIVDTPDWTIARDFRAAPRGPVWALAWAGTDRVLAGGLSADAVLWPVGGEAQLFAASQHFQTPPSEMSNGERQFVRKCSACHTLGPDGKRRAGPTLHGVFGREAGGLESYPYSEALEKSALVWTGETIDRLFSEGPDHVTPGSKMPMQRIARPEDRADLIAFLRANTGPASAPTPQPE